MSYYLDAAATAKYQDKDNIIVDVIITAMKEHWYNPSSLYASNVKEKINQSRKKISDFINAKSDEIYFTSGASESNSWALTGFVRQKNKENKKACIITSCIEHKSIESCIEGIRTKDLATAYVEVDSDGFVKLNGIEDALKSFTYWGDFDCIVSVGIANSEIGVIQDIKTISNLVHKYGAVLHVDATQALPYIPINVEDLGIDMLSASGHKLSPVLKGIGFLYIKNGINIQPLIYGSQNRGLRGSTENTFGIIGLAKAVELCDISNEKIGNFVGIRNYFLDILEDKFGCRLNGHLYNRLPNNINVTFPQNITGESLLYTLDMSGIQISTGSACNSHSIEPSRVLKAIGLTDEEAMRTVRFTLSDDITYEDIDCIVDEIEKSIKIIEI